jgi:hypothetical protein
MIKEVYIIKSGTGRYYEYAGFKPKFSANREDAYQFNSYKQAYTLLEAGGDSYGSGYDNWFSDGFYQIEKWFVVIEEKIKSE